MVTKHIQAFKRLLYSRIHIRNFNIDGIRPNCIWGGVMPSFIGILITSLFFTVNAEALDSVADWQGRYDKVFEIADRTNSSWSTSGDGWHLYNLAYGVDGAVQMWVATGDIKYLNQALLYVGNVIDTAQVSDATNFPNSSFQDGYLGWVNQSHPGLGNDGKQYPLYESYLWRYVVHMLRLMHQTPSVYNNLEYQAEFEKILGFTEQNIWEKWYSRGHEVHMYRSRTHMASHWAYISMELATITSDPLIKSQAVTVRDAIDHAGMTTKAYAGCNLTEQLTLTNNGAYFWNSTWLGAKEDPIIQDVAHGNAVITYVVEAQSIGDEWNTTDMLRFAETLDNVIWIGDSEYANNVDGSGTGNGWFNDGFIKLGRFSETLQGRLEEHTIGRGVQYFAACAVNARVLTDPEFNGSLVYGTDVIDLQPVSWWVNQREIDKAWQDEWDVYGTYSTAADSYRIYTLGFIWHAAVKAFRATGDAKYIDRALMHVENLIGDAVLSSSIPESSWADAYYGWPNVSGTHEASTVGDEVPLFETHGWRGVADVLRVIHDTGTLWNDPEYRAKYDTILSWTEKNIWEKWYTRSLNHVYRSRTHMTSHFARMAVELYGLDGTTKGDEYLAVINNFNTDGAPAGTNYEGANLMDNMVTVDDKTWWWSDFLLPGDTDHSIVQDVGHAGAVVEYMTASHDRGRHNWDGILDNIARQINESVWVSSNAITHSIDGTGQQTNRTIALGIDNLGRWNQVLQKKLELKTPTLPGFEFALIAGGALNARHYEAGTVAPPEQIILNRGWRDIAVTPTAYTKANGYVRTRAAWTAPTEGRALQIGFLAGSTWAAQNTHAVVYRKDAGTWTLIGSAPATAVTASAWNWVDIDVSWSAGDLLAYGIVTDGDSNVGYLPEGAEGMYYQAHSADTPPDTLANPIHIPSRDIAIQLRWMPENESALDSPL